MKKGVLFVVVCIFFIGLVSAEYSCSGTVSEEDGLIDVGDIESINGVKVAVVYSSVGAAEILIDAKELTLTSGENSTNFTLGGLHRINLTSVTSSLVSIKVDNIEGDLEGNKIGEVRNFSFYVSSFSGTYPGADANVKLFVGEEYLFLYGANPAEVLTLGSTEYLFKVLASDSSGAMIEVGKCSGGDFSEISEAVPEPPEVNDSLQNESVLFSPEENDTENILASPNEKIPKDIYTILIISFVVVGAILIIFFIVYKTVKSKLV